MTTGPVWAEIDLDNLAHNMREIRNITSKQAEVMAVVKANAYGHGMLEVSRVVLENGADRLGVAVLEEGVELRQAGFAVPVIILGYTAEKDMPVVVEHNLIQTVFDLEHARALSRAAVAAGKSAVIHIKVDTGMGRLGFLAEKKSVDTIARVLELPGLVAEGIFTHFSCADCDPDYTVEQIRRFSWFLEQLRQVGISMPVRHAANSAGLIGFPESHLDMVRPGIILYGLYPSAQVNRTKTDLRPVMSLKAEVASVKKVKAGSKISYGATYTMQTDGVAAVLPLGYADGYNRLLSNRGEVLVGGRRAPVIGRVCMDQVVIDVTSIPGVRTGDVAVVMGRQGGEEITADEVAQWLDTINYEVVCMVKDRIPRVYVGQRVATDITPRPC